MYKQTMNEMLEAGLPKFLEESNRIEGIVAPITARQLSTATSFLTSDKIHIGALKEFVSTFQSDAVFRSRQGLNVRVGAHRPPEGGAQIATDLEHLLKAIHHNDLSPFEAHAIYQHLHPFTDCNGRSGRMTWLWQVCKHYPNDFGRVVEFGFLHCWYYDSLQFMDTHTV